ncbi:MAG: GGDEF domain-containing protein [Lachnospiraceae bacterium]|nr:GGDEF domain-containing protein [Lachnospiraceae bacterium]
MKTKNRWPENKTEYIIYTAYRIILLACVIFLVFLFCTFRRSIDKAEAPENFQELHYIKEEKVADNRCRLGYAMEYTYELPEISGNYRTLVFYSSYNNVVVSFEGKDLYTMFGPKKGYMIWTSTHSWNHVTFEGEDSGKYVTIRLIPDYEGIATEPEEVLFGEADIINRYYVMQDMPSIILSLVAILIGIAFLVYCFINWKNEELEKNIIMLGIFAICVGFWKLTDSRALSVLIPNCPTLFEIPFFCLSLAPFAFIGYAKYLFEREDKKAWNALQIIQVFATIVVLILQITGIYEFRQSLIITHGVIFLTVLVFIYEIIREYFAVGINKNLKFNVVFSLICMSGSVLDIAAYYITSGKSHHMVFGISCFVIYIFSMGYFSATKAKHLMIEGAKAKEYARLAYQDPLTGIQNRMAYNHFIEYNNYELEHMAVIALDLNDLKKCNDTLGHEMGDVYIKTMAKILESTFQGIGVPYRMGGDEFLVLVPNAREEQLERLSEIIVKKLEIENTSYPEIDMKVAFGYAMYESDYDKNIYDMVRRADALMYANKFDMKHNKNT